MAEIAAANLGLRRCHFLQLPAEVRNRIYTLALPSACCIPIHNLALTGARHTLLHRRCRALTRCSGSPHRPPALLQTCRQIRSETESIYYYGKEFTINYNDTIAWLQSRSPNALKRIDNVVLFVERVPICLQWGAWRMIASGQQRMRKERLQQRQEMQWRVDELQLGKHIDLKVTVPGNGRWFMTSQSLDEVEQELEAGQ